MFGKNRKKQKREELKIAVEPLFEEPLSLEPLTIEKPKIGEVFVAVCADFIDVKIIRNTDGTLQYHNNHCLGSTIQNAITLLKYEGEGIFTEYYTQKTVLLLSDYIFAKGNSFAEEYGLSRYVNMSDDELNRCFSENQVLVTKFRKIYDVDKQQIGKQEANRDKLISIMNEFFDNAQFEFENKREQFLNGEQIIEDFGKAVTRKLEK